MRFKTQFSLASDTPAVPGLTTAYVFHPVDIPKDGRIGNVVVLLDGVNAAATELQGYVAYDATGQKPMTPYMTATVIRDGATSAGGAVFVPADMGGLYGWKDDHSTGGSPMDPADGRATMRVWLAVRTNANVADIVDIIVNGLA